MTRIGRAKDRTQRRRNHLQGRQAALLSCLGCGLCGWLACSSPSPSTQTPPEPPPEPPPVEKQMEASPAGQIPPEPPPLEKRAEACPADLCDPKKPAACLKTALELEKNAKTFEDWDRVYCLKEQACDAGAALESCFDVAANYNEKKKLEPAEKYYLKACDKDFAQACASLGNLYASQPETEEDPKADPPKAKGPDYPRAVQFFEKACRLKNADGCSGLGIMVADGQGAKKDLAKAVTLWQKACQYGSNVDCLTVGAFLAQGRSGVKKDLALARKMYDIACKRNYEDACKAAVKLQEK